MRPSTRKAVAASRVRSQELEPDAVLRAEEEPLPGQVAGARARRKSIAVLQDLQGPKIRTGQGAPAAIADGGTIALIEGSAGAPDAIAVEYPGLASDLHAGDTVRLDDGRIVLRVERTAGGR